ncbi:MAG: extracellular solute-binding protein, partial [Phototrophicaceae bacterium]
MKKRFMLGISFLLLIASFSNVIAQEEIVITHWYHQYGEDGTFEAVHRYAQEYSDMTPGVTVEVSWLPDYFTALSAGMLSDDAPDVFEIQVASIPMIEAGQLEPLNDLFTEEILADFTETALAPVTYEDNIYAVPMIVDTTLIYYRISLLEEAGIEPPTTMDELIAAAIALDTGRVKGLYLGNDRGSVRHLLYNSSWAAGDDLLDGTTVAFNTERTVEAWAMKQELANSGALLVGAPTEWADPSAFIDGLTAMQFGGLWAMPRIIEAFGDYVGVLPWPALEEDGTPVVRISGWSQAVNGQSDAIEESKAYDEWLWIQNTEVQTDWSLSYGFHIPPRASVAMEATALQDGIAAETVGFVLDYGRNVNSLWTGAMDSILQDAHSRVILQGADPVEE